jgi:hypothetical protein
MVWPGGSLGTLTIQGNYTQHTGGSLQIDVTPTQASQLVVSGNANLNGSLSLIFAPGTYGPTTYTVVKAGSLTGGFVTMQVIDTPPALISPQLNYTGTQANLVLMRLSVAPLNGALYGNFLRSANLVGQQTSSSVLDAALLSTDVTCDENQQMRVLTALNEGALQGFGCRPQDRTFRWMDPTDSIPPTSISLPDQTVKWEEYI